MIGNFNINHDKKLINYDFKVSVPMRGEFILTRQHVDTLTAFFDAKKVETHMFETNQLQGLHIIDMTFEDLPILIDRMEVFLSDLKKIKEQVDKDSQKN